MAQFNSQRRQRQGEESGISMEKGEGAGDQATVAMALTTVHMQGPLFLYLTGALLSLAVFLAEITATLCHPGHCTSGSLMINEFTRVN